MLEQYWAIKLDLLMVWTPLGRWQVWEWLWFWESGLLVVVPSGKFCGLGLGSFLFPGALDLVGALGNWECPEFLHWVHCKLLVVP